MRYQHQRARVLEQALFQNLERLNVKVVSRLVQQQQVRRLKHQLGDKHARSFASAQPLDGLVQLLAGKQKFCRIAGHVHHPPLVDHRV